MIEAIASRSCVVSRETPRADRILAMDFRFDVIVIGGGHAGCEAAAAAARMGASDRARDPPLRDDRRDVVQSGDRRARQGPSGARDRCLRRADGARRRPRRNSVPAAEPPQGAGGARAARAGRPQALCGGDAAGDPRDRQSRRHRRRGRRPDAPGGEGERRCPRRRAHIGRGRGRAHDRHLPAGADPYRRTDDPGRARRGGAGARPVAHAGRPGLRARPAQDRHAAAARRPHHRLAKPREPARRRSP